MADKKNRGLGRGLDALFGSSSEMMLPSDAPSDYRLERMAVEKIVRGSYQPRQSFDEESLDALAASIREQGLLSPIIVRATKTPGHYEIVAGERRFIAAQRAGLKEVPVIVRELDDKRTLALALIENLQREDLNPIEEAEGIARLIEEFDYTHEAASEAIGRSRAATTNALRLLTLAQEVQSMVRAGELSMGHARALVGLDGAEQVLLAKEIVARALSVRQTERLVAEQAKKAGQRGRQKVVIKTRDDLRLEEALADVLGTKVSLSANKKGKGKIIIEFANLEQLQGIVDKIQH